MIAEQMRKLFAYNNWAWQQVYASVRELDEAAYRAPRPIFGDSSIHNVLVHAMSAEYIWLERCRGTSPTGLFAPEDYADFDAVVQQWRKFTHGWGNYVQWLSDEDLERVVDYRNTRGNGFSLPLVDILQHVINHATEHRSQLTPILFALGKPTEPLDYMLFRLRQR